MYLGIVSERLDGSDTTNQFVQDFGRYAVGSVVPAMLGVAAIFVLTRAFVPQLYGQYALAMVFVTIGTTVATGWIGQSILRLEPELDAELLLSNVVVTLFGATITVILIGSGLYLFFPFDSQSHRWLFVAGVVLIVSRGASNVTKSVLQARLESRKATILRVSQSIGRLLIGLPLAVIVFNHPMGWMLGAAIAMIGAAVIVWHTSIKMPHLSVHPDTVRRMVSFGFPMIGWLLGFALLTFVDRILLEIFANSRAVGLYASNYEVANKALPLVFSPVIQASHPIIMNTWDGDNVSEVQSIISDMTRYLLIVGVPATGLVALSSEPLSGFLLDPRYQEGHVIIPIIAGSVFLWNVAMLAHKGLEVKEKTKTMLIGIGGATVANIGLNALLIPQYGYFGAASATLLSFVGYLVFATILAERHVPWRLPVYTLRNVSLSTAVMAVCVYFVYQIAGSSLVALIVATLTAGVVYLGGLFVGGEFTEQEMITIRKAIIEIL